MITQKRTVDVKVLFKNNNMGWDRVPTPFSVEYVLLVDFRAIINHRVQ